MIATLTGRIAVALTRFAYRHGHHTYLSTGCLHGDHAYCQTQARRYDGTTKTAAVCKFCDEGDDHGGHCVCHCHQEAP